MPSAFSTMIKTTRGKCGLVACRVTSRARSLASRARVPGSASRVPVVLLAHALVACVSFSACGGGAHAAGRRACRSCERVLSVITRSCARRASAHASACSVVSSMSRGRGLVCPSVSVARAGAARA
eukprot:3123270-Pleurochrysis_carterae.AAC.1